MKRWLYDWAAPLLVVVLGLMWLVWRAHVPVAPTGPKLRTDKTHRVVIPTDPLLTHPVLLTVEMIPPSAPGQKPSQTLVFRGCVRSVFDIRRITDRALALANDPRLVRADLRIGQRDRHMVSPPRQLTTLRRLHWSRISLTECLEKEAAHG